MKNKKIFRTSGFLKNGMFQERLISKARSITVFCLMLHVLPNIPAAALEIGTYGGIGWFSPIPATADPRLTWEVIKPPNNPRTGVTSIWEDPGEVWSTGKVPQTDFVWVQKQFDKAANNKNGNWEYGAYLLQEELFHPSVRAQWSPSKEGLNSWDIEGSTTLAGVAIMHLKPWYEQKYGAWNQSWWDGVKAVNTYNDPKVLAWSVYYGYNLHKAWHQHMRNLGKKSAEVGIVGIPAGAGPSGLNQFKGWLYPSPMWEYVLANYDAVFTYQYPTCISGCEPAGGRSISWSVDVVKRLREDYSYTGKIIHLLTSVWPDGVGSGDVTIQQAEFNAVAPYVDVIMGAVYVYNNAGPTPSVPFAPRLVQFLQDSPALTRSPAAMSFSGRQAAANPASQTLSVSNTGGGTLNWAVSANAAWLSLSPANSSSTGETDPVTVSVNTSALIPGIYNGTITITAAGAANTPQTVVVTLTVAASTGPCTTVCYVDDHAPADYIADHIIDPDGRRDEAAIQAAIDRVAMYSDSTHQGLVILKAPATPYLIRNHINIAEYVTVQGETSVPKANGDQQVTLVMAGDAPNPGYAPGFFHLDKDHVQVRNMHLDGNVTANRGQNGFWEGLTNGRGSEAIYLGGIANAGVSNILIENISVYDTTVDAIFGYGKENITVRNIRGIHIGHTVVDIRSFNANTNLLIENVYCHDLVNACIRFRAMDGAVVRNVDVSYPEINNGDRNVGYYTQFGIELWSEYAAPIQNIHFENFTIRQPGINGVIFYQETDQTASRFRNLTFKNFLIDCTPKPGATTTPCRWTNGGEPSDGPNYDREGAVRGQSVESAVFDGFTIINGMYGFRFANYFSGTSNITIKNSIVVNNTHYGVATVRGGNNYSWNGGAGISYNDFWGNALGSVGGYAVLGTGNINQNPLFASAADFHLQSPYGRWNGTNWVTTDVNLSPAISAGDPASDNSNSPTGGIIEMGAYGNTPEASKNSGVVLPFDFSLSNSGPITVEKGASAANTITAARISGIPVSTVFSVSGLPAGVAPSFSSASCSPACSTVLTLSAASGAAISTSAITVSAVAGALTKTTGFNLYVSAPLPYKIVTLSPVMDTSIKSGEADTARNTKAWLDLGRLGGTDGNYRGLLNFDLSSIPANATINSATLTLAYEGGTRTQATTIGVYRPANGWANSATWNSKQTGTPWAAAGGDWLDANGVSNGSTPYAQLTYPLLSTAAAGFDVKSLVQGYVGGTFANTGFFLKANEVDTTYVSFHSAEAVDTAKRPKLVVNYSTTDGGLDTTAPVISGVGASAVTSSGATIAWTTDEVSDSQVEYGASIAYGSSTVLNAAMVVSHSQGLAGLTASTLYHYRVKSKDAAGNLGVSGDNTFTTAAIPPALTVTAPNGGESYTGNTFQTVTWTSAGTVGNVDIAISTNGGTSWTTLVSNTPNDGSQAVTIPNTPSTACRIRVREPDGSPTDTSNNNFTITVIPGYKIQGKVQAYKSGLGTSGLSGVTLTLSGKASGAYTTGADGNYEFAGLAGGDYSITPVKSNWRFWPRVMRYTGLRGDKAGQNFIGMALNVRATVSPPAPASLAVTPLSEASSEASAISVLVPEGAFTTTTDVIMTAIEAPASDKPAIRVVGYGVSIVSDKNQQPVKNLTITMTYDKIAVSGYKEEKLVVGRYDELNQRWIVLPTTRYPGENKVVGISDHLSRFALLELLSADDLGAVKAYPNPYNPAKHPQGMKIEGLTAGAVVKIYTVTGGLIRELKEMGNLGGVSWDGRNEGGRLVASGVYIAHIKGATGVKKIKIAVEK